MPSPRSGSNSKTASSEHGFEQTMEALAYTWFNRLVAIRFMELHGYLEHGYSGPEPPRRQADAGNPRTRRACRAAGPEDKQTVIDLKLDGNKEAELYRLLLIAQCNALHMRPCRSCSRGLTTRRNWCCPTTCSTPTR